MGSSGMKRKGRQHLPKVGTKPSNERERHAQLEEAMHPFSADPNRRGTGSGLGVIITVLVAIVVIAGVIALILFT